MIKSGASPERQVDRLCKGDDMDTKKIRKRWKSEEKHEDATVDYAISQIYDLCTEVDQLQAENKKLYEALQSLCDEQNGPPLLRHKKSWQAAMDEADRLLSKHKQALKGGE